MPRKPTVKMDAPAAWHTWLIGLRDAMEEEKDRTVILAEVLQHVRDVYERTDRLVADIKAGDPQ